MCGKHIEDPRDGREGLRAFTWRQDNRHRIKSCLPQRLDCRLEIVARHVTVGDDANFAYLNEWLEAVTERSAGAWLEDTLIAPLPRGDGVGVGRPLRAARW